jgi:RNA polymerase sigma-70 factor (ECF subfamily)
VSASADNAIAAAFRDHRRMLWGLVYRMTGSAADADDLVQETFARALERPPARTDIPLRPWLVRVAANLARDRLRRRRRQAYTGPWLPSPIETHEPPAFEVKDEGIDTTGRYDLMESISYAFLVALEALKPQQRAVLLLRDVYDYSVRETAEVLGLSEANVKTTLHRARRAMQSYDRAPTVPDEALKERTRRALEGLVHALVTQDLPRLEALLLEDVRETSDGGGEFLAALQPILGRAKVARFLTKLTQKHGMATRAELRELNGLPALVAEFADIGPRYARFFVLRCDVDAEGHIAALHSILATRKLSAVQRFAEA